MAATLARLSSNRHPAKANPHLPPAIALQSVPDWQSQLRDTISSGRELLSLLQLEAQDLGFSLRACDDFPLKVPMAFARRMRAGDPDDPLLLQVLATGAELAPGTGYTTDPVHETAEANPYPGIIHKYRGRALLIVTGGCAVNCRYCFRRHFPYGDNRNSREQWRAALDYIRRDPDIEEVILSGGDPLVASDEHLAMLVAGIADVPQVRRLRIHSRLPIVIPDRITDTLLEAITHPGLKTVMVVHSNHGNEIDNAVKKAVTALLERGITALNQAVLLARVNDSSQALVDLSEALFDAGILPYYLHLLDKVQGAAHFDVPEHRARRLVGEIAGHLPGYLVPRLVREEPGKASKTTLAAIAP